MSKKLTALLLTATLFFSSFISVSAKDTNVISTTPASAQRAATTPVNQKDYRTMIPGKTDSLGFSVSVSHHAFSAYRESDGSITLYINESFNTVRCYYEHLATDASGKNFTPDKNVYFYISDEGSYSVSLAADSVSSDGYIYLKFAIDPVGANEQFITTYYKIPVDYEANKVTPDNFQTSIPEYEYEFSASATFSKYYISASRMDTGEVELIIRFNTTNASFWVEHRATSTDGDIFMPQRNGWYQLGDGDIQTNTAYRMVLPKENVSEDGYVYVNTYYLLPSPINYYPVNQFKVPVA